MIEHVAPESTDMAANLTPDSVSPPGDTIANLAGDWHWRKAILGKVARQSKEKAYPETSGLERYVAGEHMVTDDLRMPRQ